MRDYLSKQDHHELSRNKVNMIGTDRITDFVFWQPTLLGQPPPPNNPPKKEPPNKQKKRKERRNKLTSNFKNPYLCFHSPWNPPPESVVSDQ